jgi:hypothetical protein
MLPLRLCYAWTIWKAQGQTIRTKVVASLGVTEKEHGLTYTVFSRVRKASDIGIINGFPRVRLLDKVKNQGKMKARIQEEKRLDRIVKQTIKDMQNFEPLELPDVRVRVGVDVGGDLGVDAGVVVGAGIGVGVAAGNDLGAGENAAENILRPLMDDMEDKRARVREAMYGDGGESEILASITGGTSVQRKSMRTLQDGEWLNDEVIGFYLKLLAKRDKDLTDGNLGRKRSHFFSSFFFSKLFVDGCTDKYKYNEVKKWSTNVPGKDIFALDKVFFMHNVDVSHWTCAVIFMEEKRIQYYDSMGSDGHAYTTGLMIYLKDEWFEKREASYQTQTNGRLSVLWTVCRSSKMALIVVSLHACLQTFFLVTVPFLLTRITLLIKNAENELHFQY